VDLKGSDNTLNSKWFLTWALVLLATVSLNALFYMYQYFGGCTPSIGLGTPMGGGECQRVVEHSLGLVGFLGDLWLFLVGWPAANIVLGLYLSKKLKISKPAVFGAILVLAIGTVASFRFLFPQVFPY
jgi:hypothetical protein